jgi:TrmH family RNA methyltransferase
VPSETPQGVAALVHLKEFSLEEIMERLQVGPLVVIAGLQDPGNLGTILRSAEAFGGAGVILGEGTVSPFNAKVVRASAGSIFRVPVIRGKLDAVSSQLRAREIRLVATSSHKGTPLGEARLTGPLAMFIGNEGSGLRRDLTTRMDEVVVIPHAPQVESLNAGVATSILLYEAARQRK